MNLLKKLSIPINRHGHGVHSPFAYKYIRDIIDCKYSYYMLPYLWRKIQGEDLIHKRRIAFAEKRELEVIFKTAVRYKPSIISLLSTAEASPIVPYLKAANKEATWPPNLSAAGHTTDKDLRLIIYEGLPEAELRALLNNLLNINGRAILFIKLKGEMTKENRQLWQKIVKGETWNLTLETRQMGIAFCMPNITAGHFVTLL